MATIDRIPGAFWVVLFGALYAGLQAFVAAQWPDAPPASVLGLMAGLAVLWGSVKVLWPQSAPPDAAATPRGAEPPIRQSALKRFLF